MQYDWNKQNSTWNIILTHLRDANLRNVILRRNISQQLFNIQRVSLWHDGIMVDKTNGHSEDDGDLCLFIMIFCACIATLADYYYDGMIGIVNSTQKMAQHWNSKWQNEMSNDKYQMEKVFFKKS